MTTALTDLYEKWGLSRHDIAEALHTTQTVIRSWLNGAEPNADEVARADLLNDFLEDLDLGDDAGGFMSLPIVEGYTATGWDLYAAGKPDLILAYARNECTGEQALAAHDPDWRRTYWTSFKTFEAADGGRSIVGTSYDDVMQQTRPNGR